LGTRDRRQAACLCTETLERRREVWRDRPALAAVYPNEFAGVEFPAGKAPRISFKTGDPIPYDDGKEKTFDQKLEDPDLEDTFSQVYPLTNPTDRVPENFDPGRFRNEPMFLALYGASESACARGLHVGGFLRPEGDL
jgi:hypothetical protein